METCFQADIKNGIFLCCTHNSKKFSGETNCSWNATVVAVYGHWNNSYLKHKEVDLKLAENKMLLTKRVYLLSCIDMFFKRCVLYWMKKLFKSEANLVKNEFFSSKKLFPIVLSVKIVIWTQNCLKKPFPSANSCWELRISLRCMDQKNFCGSIGCGDSYLEFIINHFKIFKLQWKLHDASGAVRSSSGKRPGHCYLLGRGPNSCPLGHVTGLLFCPYVKLFTPSIFELVRFSKQYVWHCIRFWVCI